MSLGDLKKSLRKESELLAENFQKELNFENYIQFSDFVFDYIINYDNQNDYFDVFADFIHLLKHKFDEIQENKESKDNDRINNAYKQIKEELNKKFEGMQLKINK